MPRAHCLDCGDHVVVDPAGRCPEGHHVGVPGARIEGSLGTSHPDEPEPWVAKVVLDEELATTASVPPRLARPLAAPPAPERGPGTPHATATARPDDLLRELHSLGDLSGPPPTAASTRPLAAPTPPIAPVAPPARSVAPPSPPVAPPSPPVAPPTPSVAPPPAATVRPPAPRPTEDPAPWSAPVAPPAAAERDAFEELSALEAAVQALSNSNGHHANGNGNGNGHHNGHHADGNGHHANGTNGNGHGASLDELFGPELAVGTTVADPAPPADAAPWSAPVEEVPRSVTDQLDELFAAAEQAPAPPRPHPAPPAATLPSAPAPAPSPTPAEAAGPSRWSVLADVAEFAESAPVGDPAPAPVPTAPTSPPPSMAEVAELAQPDAPAPVADPGIDLANFTARGKRVGSDGKGKRRLFGR